MADPDPVPENTMFQGTPLRVWQVYTDPEAMAQEEQDVMDWIDELLENRNEPLRVNSNGEEHTVQLTANEGVFRLLMRFPPELLLPGQPSDLMLAFSLEDIYLLGFLDGNVWRFFEDARLDEIWLTGEWDRLPFRGGYSGNIFNTVELGVTELGLGHEALTSYSQRVNKDRDSIHAALLRIIFAISEAKRFPYWLKQVLMAFSTDTKTIVGNTFGKLFQNWSVISKEVLKGPRAFKPFLCYSTYGDAVAAIAVARNRVKLKASAVTAALAAQVAADNEKKKVVLSRLFDYDDSEEEEEDPQEVITEDELQIERMPRRRIASPAPRRRTASPPPRPTMPRAVQLERHNAKACCICFLMFLLIVCFWYASQILL